VCVCCGGLWKCWAASPAYMACLRN
jgi:hypothetical protein